MATLLVINSSPRSTSSSNALTQHFIEQWKQKNTTGKVILRNVATENMPYVTEAWIGAVYTPEDKLTAEQKATIALSDKLVAELVEADTILIGSPMWNFGIAAPLKAWIDQVVRVGKTFSYSEKGPKGLLDANKKVIIAAARGAAYGADSPYASFDQQTPYLKTILGFMGLTDVKFIYAENQLRGPADATAGLNSAKEQVVALA